MNNYKVTLRVVEVTTYTKVIQAKNIRQAYDIVDEVDCDLDLLETWDKSFTNLNTEALIEKDK